MFLAALISGEGLAPEKVETTATVTLGKDDTGPYITHIKLDCTVSCTGLTPEKLQQLATSAKANCPISRLYAGGSAKIDMKAELV